MRDKFQCPFLLHWTTIKATYIVCNDSQNTTNLRVSTDKIINHLLGEPESIIDNYRTRKYFPAF
jgi:hypothetical protein